MGSSGAIVTPAGIGADTRFTTVATKTSAYPALAWQIVPVDTTGGAVTITLPAAATAGIQVCVVLIAGSNPVTIARAGADLIDGATTSTITLVGACRVLVADGGTGFRTVSGHNTLGSLDGRFAPTFGAGLPIIGGPASSAGSAAAPARVDHAHPRGAWTSSDYGLLALTHDPAIGGNYNMTAGVMYFSRMHLPVAATATNIHIGVYGAGSSLTAGQNFAMIYSAAGALLGTTADQSASWNSTGWKTMPIAGGPVELAAGDYYGAIYFNGSGTAVSPIGRTGFGLSYNLGLVSPNLRMGSANTGLTTAPPANMGGQANSGLGPLVGLS